VHVLLAEGREEFNLDKAKDTYKAVQKTIVRGEQLEFYADVERLLPEHTRPECLEQKMDIQEYVRDERRIKGEGSRSPIRGAKRKRNNDVLRNIPAGASTGFVSVAELIVKNHKKRKKVPEPKDFDVAGQDDDVDLEIESGLVLPRRTKFATVSRATGKKAKLRKGATVDGFKDNKKQEAEPTSSQFSSKGIDDSDDLEIERGIVIARESRHSAPGELITCRPTPDDSSSAPVVGKTWDPDINKTYGDG
jgi:ATP-dependent DNA helicase MPH1